MPENDGLCHFDCCVVVFALLTFRAGEVPRDESSKCFTCLFHTLVVVFNYEACVLTNKTNSGMHD